MNEANFIDKNHRCQGGLSTFLTYSYGITLRRVGGGGRNPKGREQGICLPNPSNSWEEFEIF